MPLQEMLFRLGATSQGPTRKSPFTTPSAVVSEGIITPCPGIPDEHEGARPFLRKTPFRFQLFFRTFKQGQAKLATHRTAKA